MVTLIFICNIAWLIEFGHTLPLPQLQLLSKSRNTNHTNVNWLYGTVLAMNSLKGKKGKICQLKKQKLFLIVSCLQLGFGFCLFVSFTCYFVTYLLSNLFRIGRDNKNNKIWWFWDLVPIENAVPESFLHNSP